MYIYLINTNFNFIIIRNNKILSLIISRYYRVNLIIKYEAKEEYSINIENYFLIAKVDSIRDLIIADFINLLNLKTIIEKIEINSSTSRKGVIYLIRYPILYYIILFHDTVSGGDYIRSLIKM